MYSSDEVRGRERAAEFLSSYPGISAEQASKILKLFPRSEGTKTLQEKGAGEARRLLGKV